MKTDNIELAIEILRAKRLNHIAEMVEEELDAIKKENTNLEDSLGIQSFLSAQEMIDSLNNKVLVDVDDLRNIEWVSLATRVGVTACPVCGGSRDCGGHANNNCWLNELLNE